MAQIIDIASRVTNELPMVRVTNELTITVNNRKNTIMSMQAMIQEVQKKSTDGTFDELKLMNKVMTMLVGEKATKEIDEMNLPFPEYKLVYRTIMEAATGAELEEVEESGKRFQ